MRRIKRRDRSEVNPEYLKWLRSRPCYICSKILRTPQLSPTEAAHVGDRGMGQKCPDLEAIPLCGMEHHREGKESHHRLGRNFWTHWKIDKRVVLDEMHERYGLLEAA